MSSQPQKSEAPEEPKSGWSHLPPGYGLAPGLQRLPCYPQALLAPAFRNMGVLLRKSPGGGSVPHQARAISKESSIIYWCYSQRWQMRPYSGSCTSLDIQVDVVDSSCSVRCTFVDSFIFTAARTPLEHHVDGPYDEPSILLMVHQEMHFVLVVDINTNMFHPH